MLFERRARNITSEASLRRLRSAFLQQTTWLRELTMPLLKRCGETYLLFTLAANVVAISGAGGSGSCRVRFMGS